MRQGQAGTDANLGEPGYRYERHRPEPMRPYQPVRGYYPAFVAQLAAQGTELPEYVQREFEGYLGCGCLEYDFLRVHCDPCHDKHLVALRCKRRGVCPIETCRECGDAVKVIACIEAPGGIEKILTHLHEKAASTGTGLLPESRASP